ncbi:MAG: peptidase [Alphaproteobacteria bacterium]|nr:peptidase [Alphaproteobacteria bacterium]
MTFCLAMKLKDGIIGFADSRITTGVECIIARKVTVFEHENHSMFMMTSGLRAARDKALTYFSEIMEEMDHTFDKLYKAVNEFAQQIRRVQFEDRKGLEESGLHFNLHCIIGGQLERDETPKLYLLYPQGNWVEVSEGTPYYIIGESSYGKPLLDRALNFDTDLETALKIGYLAFNATMTSATDVGFPLDIVVYPANSYKMIQQQFVKEDFKKVDKWWMERIRKSVKEVPNDWSSSLTDQIKLLRESVSP